MHDVLVTRSARASRPAVHHAVIRFETDAPRQFIDITERVAQVVAACRLGDGIVNVQTRHTTAGIVVNEHEPLLLDDLRDLLEWLAPSTASYRHDDIGVRRVNVQPGERRNGHAHCQALLLPASACINVVGGHMDLGRWQRIFFVELDGAQPRQVSLTLLGVRS